jgi:hypothetical protein
LALSNPLALNPFLGVLAEACERFVGNTEVSFGSPLAGLFPDCR